MKTAKLTRALGLGVTAVLVTTAFPFTPASADPGAQLVATSQDGAGFELADYAAGDITVQFKQGGAAVDVDDSQDLEYSWEFTPYAGSSAVRVPPLGSDDVQPTDTNGKFVVALPVGQGPGTYVLSVVLTADSDGHNAISDDDVLKVAVGNDVPMGTTSAITDLAAGTPGQARPGTLTVMGPGSAPVVGQVFSLSVDHGFFTPTAANATFVEGATAGNLEQRGTKLTGVTNGAGQIEFSVGIARDGGFDDDGSVAATVKAVSGPAASSTAAWSSANPLNGGGVEVRLSPAGRQDGPVNPTLAGNRTFYDVFALDQFGNPVDGAEIELTFPGNVGEADIDADTEDVVSNLTSFGDVAITLLRAGFVDVTGTWEEAPSTVYGPSGALPATTKIISGSTRSNTYEINFNASRFSLSSSVNDTVRVGTTVTQTVRAVDQQGNPIEDFQVRFLRFGPDATNGDVVATRTTNALGEATYSFIGTRRGRAVITAEVSDGNRRRELTGTAAFGAGVRARLAKAKSTTSADRMTVSAGKVAAGARVDLYRVTKGVEKRVGSHKANSKGTVAFKIRDRNRNKKTTYVAVVRSTSKSIADRSNALKTR